MTCIFSIVIPWPHHREVHIFEVSVRGNFHKLDVTSTISSFLSHSYVSHHTLVVAWVSPSPVINTAEGTQVRCKNSIISLLDTTPIWQGAHLLHSTKEAQEIQLDSFRMYMLSTSFCFQSNSNILSTKQDPELAFNLKNFPNFQVTANNEMSKVAYFLSIRLPPKNLNGSLLHFLLHILANVDAQTSKLTIKVTSNSHILNKNQ